MKIGELREQFRELVLDPADAPSSEGVWIALRYEDQIGAVNRSFVAAVRDAGWPEGTEVKVGSDSGSTTGSATVVIALVTPPPGRKVHVLRTDWDIMSQRLRVQVHRYSPEAPP